MAATCIPGRKSGLAAGRGNPPSDGGDAPTPGGDGFVPSAGGAMITRVGDPAPPRAARRPTRRHPQPPRAGADRRSGRSEHTVHRLPAQRGVAPLGARVGQPGHLVDDHPQPGGVVRGRLETGAQRRVQ